MTRRWLWSIGAIVIGAVVVCGLGGIVLCEAALHRARRPVPSNPLARTVQVTARDGAILRGWMFTPERPNGNAVLVLHGIADSRASQSGLAGMFLEHGYTVLTPDSRAHGESGGDVATYGLLEADDVHRWVSWLIDDQSPRHIFGMGESLGGGVLIESLPIEPRFSAIVADSAFASLQRVALDRIAERLPLPLAIGRIVAAPPVWAAFLYARVRYGLDFRQASPEAALARSMTPVLLIHGLNDKLTLPEHSEILAASNRQWTELWLVPGATHTGAFSTARAEFEDRVIGFFEAYQNLPSGR